MYVHKFLKIVITIKNAILCFYPEKSWKGHFPFQQMHSKIANTHGNEKKNLNFKIFQDTHTFNNKYKS